jgi:hypothetical protein
MHLVAADKVTMSAIPKSIETAWKKEMEKVVRSLSEKYNFDFEEAMESLGAAKKTTTTPAKKQPAAKRAVPAYPIPFVGTVQEDWCKAVKNNHGLMTQCTMPAVSGDWCKTCAKQAEANESNEPTLGSITSRVGKEDWVAPNGKAPVPYHKVIAKLNLAESKDQIIEEAAKFGMTLTEEMFVAPEVEKAEAKRGRPKKEKPTVSAAEGDDLISNLVAEAQANMPTSPVVEEAEQPNVQYLGTAVEKEATKKAKKAAKKPKMTEEEKTAAKAKKEEEKAAAKAKKEEERAAAKLQKEQERAAAKAQKEATKAKKAQQDQEKADAKEANAQQEAAEVEEEEYDDEAVKVERFEHEGKEYLRSADNVLYDAETHAPVGQWNESEGKIEELNDEEF